MSGTRKAQEAKAGSSEDPDCRPEQDMGFTMESCRKYLEKHLGFFREDEGKSSQAEASDKIIETLTFDGLIEHWKTKGFKKIVTMVGAGISTSAGIPDFRSPGTGLYDNLEKYNLPHPSAIFEMDYFRNNPKPFFVLAKELYPGSFKPTPCHYFIRMLQNKGLLVRHYTQNIDTLERIAGIEDGKIVEAHGTFFTNHCLECGDEYDMEWMRKQIFADKIPTCTRCPGVVKPDIVFFGENLPDKFYSLPADDFKKCDLLIIMGTSLEVQPFASLIDRANSRCVRLLINREKVGSKRDLLSSWLLFGQGLLFDDQENKRDIARIGNCDDGVYALADGLGWGDELRTLIKKEHARIEKLTKHGKGPWYLISHPYEEEEEAKEEIEENEITDLNDRLSRLGTNDTDSKDLDIQSRSSGVESSRSDDDETSKGAKKKQ